MNDLRYNDIEVGLTHSFTVQITKQHQDMFRDMTQDINPLHADAPFAKKQGFSDMVVFGMLSASFFSTLVGVYIPGKNALLQSVETKFLKPVYIGDQLTISGTVKEKNDAFHLLILKGHIRNQNNEKVVKAVLQVGVLD